MSDRIPSPPRRALGRPVAVASAVLLLGLAPAGEPGPTRSPAVEPVVYLVAYEVVDAGGALEVDLDRAEVFAERIRPRLTAGSPRVIASDQPAATTSCSSYQVGRAQCDIVVLKAHMKQGGGLQAVFVTLTIKAGERARRSNRNHRFSREESCGVQSYADLPSCAETYLDRFADEVWRHDENTDLHPR